MSNACFDILPEFWKRRLAKAWFSRSIRSFSFRLTEMFRERGPTPAGDFYFAFCYAAGPCTDDHLPWEMSTSLFNRIAFSLLSPMFFSVIPKKEKIRNIFDENNCLTVLIKRFALRSQCLFVVLLKFDLSLNRMGVEGRPNTLFHLQMCHVVAAEKGVRGAGP